MIFATVGTQLPFDRLITTLDQWAAERNRRDVFAQVGISQREPQWIDWRRSLTPSEFNDRLESARIVVAHAGIGSILSALELGKPIVVIPRLSQHGEHRNDHQVATAKRFLSRGLVSVAWDEQQLCERLDDLESFSGGDAIEAHASTQLLERVRKFISSGSAAEIVK